MAPVSRTYRLDQPAREAILAKLTTALSERPELSFALVFGSFLTADAFRDIDVAIWTVDPLNRQADLELAVSLSRSLGFPIDVRRINDAPVPFLFHALRGRVVTVRDEELLANLMESTARAYHDRAPLLRRATREAFAG